MSETDLLQLARRLELAVTGASGSRISATYDGLGATLEWGDRLDELVVRLDAPSELPATFDANPGGPTTFTQLTIGDEAFDRAVRVRSADEKRVSLRMALTAAPDLRAQLIGFFSGAPSASIEPRALRLSAPVGDDSGLARKLRQAAAIVQHLARLDVRAEPPAPAPVERLAAQLALEDVTGTDLRLTGTWAGLPLTLEQRGELFSARLTSPRKIGGTFRAAPAAGATRLVTGHQAFDQGVHVECAEGTYDAMVEELGATSVALRDRLASFFTRHATATIGPDGLVVTARADELEPALRLGAPLMKSLAGLNLNRSGGITEIEWDLVRVIVGGTALFLVVVAIASRCG